MNRTPKSWAQLLFFYFVFYALLAAFFAIMMAVFLQTLDDNHPKWYADSSVMFRDHGSGWGPGMGYAPRGEDVGSSLIWLKSDGKNAEMFKQNMKEKLEAYNEVDENAQLKDCNDDEFSTEEYACKYDVSTYLKECSEENEFGYANDKPCVFVTLNRIYGWKPEPFDNLDDAPDELRSYLERNNLQLNRNALYVICDGEDPVDQENVGKVKMYPADGIPLKYFPYYNQPGYKSPLVAVQFETPRKNTLINIVCRAYGKNIGYDSKDRLGATSFELLVDGPESS